MPSASTLRAELWVQRIRTLVVIRSLLLFAYVAHFALQRAGIEAVDRQGEHQLDPPLQHERGVQECLRLLLGRAFLRGGIGDSPMGRHRLTRPDRARFAGSVVADGENEVEVGRPGAGEFLPALAAKALGR